MMTLVSFVSLLAAPTEPGWSQVEAPRVAVIYSDFGSFRHRDDYDARLADLGWPLSKVENTRFGELAAQLASHDLVIGSALFNYSNVQDFGVYKDSLLRFVREGGALVLTDCSYPAHLGWLSALGDGFEVTCRSTKDNPCPMGWIDPSHPLFLSPHRITDVGGSWAEMATGPAWRVLARSQEGGVTVAIREEGRGFILLTNRWPHNRAWLENEWAYLRCRRAGVVVELPDLSTLKLGENRFAARLTNLTAKPLAVQVQVSDTPASGAPRTVSARADLAPEGEASVEVVLPEVRARGEHELVATASVDGKPFLVGPATRVVIPPLLGLEVARPRYRGSIYLASPPEEVVVHATVGPDPGDTLADLSLRGRLDPGGREVTVRPLVGATTDFTFPRDKAAGTALRVSVALRRGDTVLAREALAIPVVGPRPGQVSLDETGAAVLDGKPFFPIGIYHAGAEVFPRLRQMGFNTTVAWGTTPEGAKSALDAAQQAGLKVILEMSSLLRGELDLPGFEAVVRRVEAHPALLTWYPVDEPFGEQLAWCRAAYGLLTRTEPHHPAYLVICDPNAFGEFAVTTDILAIDPYPIDGAPIDMVASWMERAQEAVDGQKPIWLIPQCQNNTAYTDPTKGRGPTPAEERCMVYQGLIHGAKGIIYYPWDDGPCGLTHDPALMEAVEAINRELAELGADLLASERHLVADDEPGQPGLRAASFVGKGQVYLIATNTGREALQASLPLPGALDEEVQALFEGRRVRAEGGIIRDAFPPLAVHVYRLTYGPGDVVPGTR